MHSGCCYVCVCLEYLFAGDLSSHILWSCNIVIEAIILLFQHICDIGHVTVHGQWRPYHTFHSYWIKMNKVPSSLWYTAYFSSQLDCWSLRCSWSIACRRCSNYIFILNLTPGFNRLGKDKYKMRREAFEFWELLCLILETLRYIRSPWCWRSSPIRQGQIYQNQT